MDELQRSQTHRPFLLKQLQERLSYRFHEVHRLEEALTHRSFGQPHNERLEYLGDAVLGLLIAQTLFESFPKLDEGSLSRIRASLVCEATLTEIASALNFGEYLRLGAGEKRNLAQARGSLLADSLEACLGAVYLDGGLPSAKALVDRLFQQRIEQIDPAAVAKDPKTRLQERLQRQKLTVPQYTIIAIHGEDHAQEFEVRCEVQALALHGLGRGSNKRQAEQLAAARLLAAWDMRSQAL